VITARCKKTASAREAILRLTAELMNFSGSKRRPRNLRIASSTSTTINSFIASLDGKLPEPISVSAWLALGKPDTTVYLPLYYGLENLPPSAGLGIRTHDCEVFYKQHFGDAEIKSAKDRLLHSKVFELQKIAETNYASMIGTIRQELFPAEKTFVENRRKFESDFSSLSAKDKKEALKKFDAYAAAAFNKISDLYAKILAKSH
jgi:dipeptidase